MWAMKVLLIQRDTILRLNKKILEQSTAIKEVAKLKERNRIAEEVHDTVGHTLTTAIVALEGAHLIFRVDPEESHRKILIAKEQLKHGLGDIRGVVKALKETDEFQSSGDFFERINGIIRNVEEQTSIHIALDYEMTIELLSVQEHVIINAIKEGITNAIKHGKATKIKMILETVDHVICVEILDNGTSTKAVEFGFGLSTMKSRVEAIGGTLEYKKLGTGFKLVIMSPVMKEG